MRTLFALAALLIAVPARGVDVPPGLSSIAGDATASFWAIRSQGRVALGLNFSCAIPKDHGGALCWGQNENGVLGSGKSFEELPWSAKPLEALFQDRKDRKPLRDLVALAAGNHHACALTAGGAVWCWGQGELGQLGDGPDPYRQRSAAVQVLTKAGEPLSKAVAIGAGSYHACAIVQGGNVWCWGHNLLGREPVRFATQVAGVSGATALATGGDRECAIVAGGAVTCWGRDPRTGRFLAPTAIPGISGAISVVGGAFHHCALASGEVYCWGSAGHGQLGNGERGEGKDHWPPEAGVVKLDSDLGRATTIAAGAFHTCATSASPRQTRCWGNNATRQALGYLGGTTCDEGSASFPCQPQPELVHRDGENPISNTVRVFAGGYHSCALVLNVLHCWGFNGFGQLGEKAPKGEGGAGPTETLKLE